ncbi:MAG: PKD domain-containing protein, partial [Candidatus Thermoplasmatota archaeon]|nr:PKD domain-containing protein [Candidatus Thermoplasmatota archaeon]
MDSEKVAVIIDACYSEGMIDDNASTWITKFSGEINNETRVIVTCCGEHELGYPDHRNGTSFSYFIMEGLQGNADNLSEGGDGDGVVSIEEAYNYAVPRCEEYLGNLESNPVIYDSDNSSEIELTTVELPPDMPILYGDNVTIGQLNTTYFFNVSSTDPENNNITYGWNWSKDRSFDTSGCYYFFSGWGGYDVGNWSANYSSGDNCTMSHSWDKPGIYAVRTKARDEFGAERIENLEYTGLWCKPRYLLINAEDEIVDQYNLKATYFNACLFPYSQAQSFVPNSSYLSKVKLKLHLNGGYGWFLKQDDFKNSPLNVSIRKDSQDGENLAFASKRPLTELKESKSLVDWVEFDFPNIVVIPNETYFIVVEYDECYKYSIYQWIASYEGDDGYPQGNASAYSNGSWVPILHTDDFCFITYEAWPVDAGGPYYKLLNEQPIQFNGLAFGNPPYTWFWDFGDEHNSTLQNPNHTYESIGNYTVKLTVTDNDNITANDTTWANIRDYNNPPNAPNKPSGSTI